MEEADVKILCLYHRRLDLEFGFIFLPKCFVSDLLAYSVTVKIVFNF